MWLRIGGNYSGAEIDRLPSDICCFIETTTSSVDLIVGTLTLFDIGRVFVMVLY